MLWKRLSTVAACLVSAALYAGPSLASVIYTYTGNSFTNITDNTPPSGTYTTADFVSGYFMLDSALGANLALTNVSVLPGFEFSLNDGRQTVDSLSASLLITNFRISTDALGDVRRWIIAVSYPAANSAGAQSANITSVYSGSTLSDFGTIRERSALGGLSLQDAGWVDNNPGSWTAQQIPVPAVLPLLGTGGLALLFGLKRSK